MEKCAEGKEKHEFLMLECVLLLFSIAVLDGVKIVFRESFYSDVELYPVFWFAILYGTAMFIVSAEIIIKIVFETLHFHLSNPLRYMLLFYFFMILGILELNYYISPVGSRSVFNEPVTMESRVGSGLSVFLAKAIFLCFVLDFSEYKTNRYTESDKSLMDFCRFLIFALWIIGVYLVNLFITAQKFNEDVSNQIILADTIFSFFLAVAATTGYGDERSLVNTLIRITKKMYSSTSSIDVLMIILSGLVAFGGVIYTVWISSSLSELGGNDSNFYPGLFITLIMFMNLVSNIHTCYFSKWKANIPLDVECLEEKEKTILNNYSSADFTRFIF